MSVPYERAQNRVASGPVAGTGDIADGDGNVRSTLIPISWGIDEAVQVVAYNPDDSHLYLNWWPDGYDGKRDPDHIGVLTAPEARQLAAALTAGADRIEPPGMRLACGAGDECPCQVYTPTDGPGSPCECRHDACEHEGFVDSGIKCPCGMPATHTVARATTNIPNSPLGEPQAKCWSCAREAVDVAVSLGVFAVSAPMAHASATPAGGA